MDEYVAVVRLMPSTRPERLSSLTSAARSCRQAITGVFDAVVDPTAGALQIRFDRARTTVADIVRCLEDQGLNVAAVAQCRADSGVQAASA